MVLRLRVGLTLGFGLALGLGLWSGLGPGLGLGNSGICWVMVAACCHSARSKTPSPFRSSWSNWGAAGDRGCVALDGLNREGEGSEAASLPIGPGAHGGLGSDWRRLMQAIQAERIETGSDKAVGEREGGVRARFRIEARARGIVRAWWLWPCPQPSQWPWRPCSPSFAARPWAQP